MSDPNMSDPAMPDPTTPDPAPEPSPEPPLASRPTLDPPPGVEAAPVPTAAPPPPVPAPAPVELTNFHIGEEFGTAKRNLPPIGILLICIAAVAVAIGIFAFKERPKPQGSGTINFVSAAEVPGQNMILAAVTMTLKNTADKPLWIHTLKAELTTDDGKTLEDEAASAVDVARYLQGFPGLNESAEPPLSPETKLAPGAEQKGTIIVGFKVSKEAFEQRKSLTVAIQPYDQSLPVVLR